MNRTAAVKELMAAARELMASDTQAMEDLIVRLTQKGKRPAMLYSLVRRSPAWTNDADYARAIENLSNSGRLKSIRTKPQPVYFSKDLTAAGRPRKLRHYRDLVRLRQTDPILAEKWAKAAVVNFGGRPASDFQTNMRFLDTNAQETDEEMVTDEVNGLIEIVTDTMTRD